MSAIGSVSIPFLLPAALGHTGDGSLMSQLPQADAAEPELLEHGTRAAAAAAARVHLGLVLRRPLLLDAEGGLGHALVPSALGGEGQAQMAQQGACLVVRLRRRRDGDVEAPDRLDAVVVDLREDDLLPDAERVVAAAVEGVGVETPEVADARQGDRD